MAALLYILSVLSALVSLSMARTDETIVPKTYGYDCVQAVNAKIKSSGIFGEDDNRFLIRIAYVETKFGTAKQTYSTPTSGGIWQVKNNIFTHTKQDTTLLNTLRSKITNEFGINWQNVTLSDLEKPLYSGLAIKIYLASVQKPIPDTITRQAEHWKLLLNNHGDSQRFFDEVKSLEKVSPCTGRMNLVLVMDGSGSIGDPNFQTAKKFVADLASTFDSDDVPMAFIVYSDKVNVVFNLTSKLDNTARREAILNASYPNQGTLTHLAIDEAVELLTEGNKNINNQHKLSSPNILVVFTDGQSNQPLRTVNSSLNAAANNVTTFACGIGGGVSYSELFIIADNNSNHVLSSSSFDALTEFPYRVNEETCLIPQTPPNNGSVKDSVNKDETRYFAYELPREGMTMSVVDTLGRTEGFYSYSYRTPSPAIHDGVINEVVTFIPYPKDSRRRRRDVSNSTKSVQLYLALRGMEDKNEFNITTVEGPSSTGTSNNLRGQISILLVIVGISAQIQNVQF